MKIYHFSRILALPCVLIIGYFLYQMTGDEYVNNSFWLVPAGLALAVIYVFNPQIDHWWQRKFPFSLDQEVKDLLSGLNPYYNTLQGEELVEFENRMSLYINGRDFSAMGAEKQSVPYDLKALIAQIPIQLTMNRKDYLLGEFNRIVLYKHPFPSPQFPFLHAMETYAEDGVILMSLEHLEAAINKPKQFYHIGYHSFAEAFIKRYPAIDWPDMDKVTWERLEEVSGFKKQALLQSVGFEYLDLLPVCITYYFVFPQKFGKEFPDVKIAFDDIFINDQTLN